ncbi:MAG: GH92 family glycosyl hydrolase [Terracidiphilus sp.]|jgi:predicted alpha-1,2-mannosidase
MRSFFAFPLASALLALLSAIPALAQSASPQYDAVDPIIGTSGGGATFPGAALPWGMVQWSPDTNKNNFYIYNDKQIRGFSLTHLSGVGCPIYGDFSVLPTTTALATSPGTNFDPYAAAFDHSNEVAHPGFYAVTLANGIRVEITVAERSGIARFVFPEGQSARLLVNAGSSANSLGPPSSVPGNDRSFFGNQIELTSPTSYVGSSTGGNFCGPHSEYTIYVAGRFSKPYKTSSLWQDDTIEGAAKSVKGKHTGAWLDFGNEHEVLLKVGVSYVSEAGALRNLDQEIPAWDFDQAHEYARSAWARLLGRIAVGGGTAGERKIFYTALYHSLLHPSLFSDRDGSYIGFDNQVHSLAGSKQKAQYANFSDWDIYRNTVQLQALLEPATESDMMQSLVNDAVQSGWLPRWPAANDVTYVMHGDSPAILLSSSYAFGAHDFDVKTALKYMVKAGTEPGVGPHGDSERPFLADYRKLGFVPVDKSDIGASITLEYANADFAVAQFAKNLGNEADYQTFLNQSKNWTSLFDPSIGWIRPRNSDGTWLAGFNADLGTPKTKISWDSKDQEGFEEGNSYQYTFMIPFDYPTLFAAIGGDDKVIPRLDKFFSRLRCWGDPCFNMENEPDFVTPYAYVFAGAPWKTQSVVTRIANETFTTKPDGIPGNDDLGATSGVYVWNALGFYPAVPGVGGVVLGTPMFDKATLQLAGGRTLVVTHQGLGFYVQKVTLNGAPYPSSWLPLDKLRPGTTQLQFTTSAEPNKERGSAIADRPPSFR